MQYEAKLAFEGLTNGQGGQWLSRDGKDFAKRLAAIAQGNQKSATLCE
jgi:hypothetical protein